MLTVKANDDRLRWISEEMLEIEKIKERLDRIESVLPVVRCRDCKYFDMSDVGGTIPPIVYRCKRFARTYREAEDFCSRGERKETEDYEDIPMEYF